MKPRQIVWLSLGMSLMASAALCQSKTCAAIARGTPAFSYCFMIEKVASAQGDQRVSAAADLATFFTDTQDIPAAMHYSMLAALFQNAQGMRTDKQTGAPASANGTTNLVSLPGATDFLSVAVAAGAVSETTSGTTTTISGNLGQMLGYFKDGAEFDYSLHGVPVLQNIDATISIANFPGSGTTVPVTTSGNAASGNATVPSGNTSVTGATARYQLFNKYDPHTPQFKNALLTYESQHQGDIQTAAQNEAKATGTLVSHFVAAAHDLQTLDQERQKFVAAQDTEDLVNLFNAYFNTVIQKASKDKTFNADLAAFVTAMQANLNEYREIVNSAKGVPALTIEYTYTNSPNQPITHNVRLIGGLQSPNGMMLTFNSAGTFYQNLPSGSTVGHFRDFQFSAQGDVPISFGGGNHAADLSFAGYGQYQSSPSLLSISASDLPSGFPTNAPALVAGTQGWLGIGQVKLSVKNSNGVEIVPISWKYSNREDVFSKSQSGFQFGLSYDISSLKQLVGIQ